MGMPKKFQEQAVSVKNVEPISGEVDRLLSQSEVARMLNKSPQTIGRWINDGLLRFVRQPDGLPKIRKSEIDAFLGVTCLKVVG